MTAQDNGPIEERVARLEERLESLQGSLKQLTDIVLRREGGDLPARPLASRRPSASPPKPAVSPKSAAPAVGLADRGGEFWLNKIGIALVLFGVVFLFKYAVDQGWLTPAVRVLIGLLVGATLYVLGLRFRERQRWFATTLLGGGIAAFYITGFAAFQLYALVSHPVAYAFMVGVSVLAFYSALREDEAALSAIGVLGALATPFLLYTGTGSVPALMSYTSIVVAAAAMVYLMKGWNVLLWVTLLTTWGVLFVPLFDVLVRDLDRWALVGAALVAWLAFWGVPVVREGLVMTQPDRWHRSEPPPPLERHVEILTIGVPLFVLYYIAIVWEPAAATLGWLAVLGAWVYAAACWALHLWRTDERLWYAHAASSVILMTVALGFLLEGGWLLMTWAVEVAALHYVAQRTGNRATAAGANLLFAIVTVWLFTRFGIEVRGRPAIVALPALHDLVTIGAGFAAAHVMPPDPKTAGKPLGSVVPTRALYRIVAYVALLLWLWRELSVLPNGNGLVTVAWGILGAGLLVTGLIGRRPFVRRVALGTLLAVVGKLFLVDLASVEALWRIMLFLGFGAIFLVLSYYFRDLWQDAGDDSTRVGDSTA